MNNFPNSLVTKCCKHRIIFWIPIKTNNFLYLTYLCTIDFRIPLLKFLLFNRNSNLLHFVVFVDCFLSSKKIVVKVWNLMLWKFGNLSWVARAPNIWVVVVVEVCLSWNLGLTRTNFMSLFSTIFDYSNQSKDGFTWGVIFDKIPLIIRWKFQYFLTGWFGWFCPDGANFWIKTYLISS